MVTGVQVEVTPSLALHHLMLITRLYMFINGSYQVLISTLIHRFI